MLPEGWQSDGKEMFWVHRQSPRARESKTREKVSDGVGLEPWRVELDWETVTWFWRDERHWSKGRKEKGKWNNQEAGRQNNKTEKGEVGWGRESKWVIKKVEKENLEVQLTLSAQTPNWSHRGLSFGFHKVLLFYVRFHELLLQHQDTDLEVSKEIDRGTDLKEYKQM